MQYQFRLEDNGYSFKVNYASITAELVGINIRASGFPTCTLLACSIRYHERQIVHPIICSIIILFYHGRKSEMPAS